MRVLVYLGCAIALGCGRTDVGKPDDVDEQAASTATPAPVDLPADLGTREFGDDWSAFLGPFHNGVSAEKGMVSPWPKEGLRVVWQKQVGTGYGMPAVSRGRLFQFDRQGDMARLTCMKSETGEFLWQYEYPTDYKDYYAYNNGPRCSAVVDQDRVYVYGAEGLLCCIKVLDGKLLWKVDTKAQFGVVQNFFGVGSTPVIEGDLLIAQVGGSPPNSGDQPTPNQKGNGSGIVAFDKYTGMVRYQVTDELASYSVPMPATIGGRRWCFVFARGGLVGMRPANGKVEFHYPWRAKILESVNAANPVVVGDQVFISETYGPGSALMQVKPGGYKELWTDADKPRKKSMQAHWSTPIYCDSYLYGCSGRHDSNAELRCIEWATGKVMWSEPGLYRTSLLMVDGHFICLGEDGTLLLLKVNPNRYEEVSRMDSTLRGNADGLLEYPCWAAPILAHGLLYVRGKDRLVCYELIPAKR